MRLLLVFALLTLVTSAFAQHLGARVQWQPQTMAADARLDQPVQIEIIGRAAAPALALLSEATGVSLTVAPEDLNTVGERKLTLIAKGLTLKAIMVQLPEALQEAHWDIDTSGEQPVYLLHRNAGVDDAAQRERQQRTSEIEFRTREARTQRFEEARHAREMSPDELAKLEVEDILLARALRHPITRAAMDAVLSLPEDLLEHFTETGQLQLPYAQASEAVQRVAFQAARAQVEENIRLLEKATPEEREYLPELKQYAANLTGNLNNWVISIRFSASIGSYLYIVSPDHGGPGVMAIPPRRPVFARQESLSRLLRETGSTETEAQQVIETMAKQRRQILEQEQQRSVPDRGAPAPELSQPSTIEVEEGMQLWELQQALAQATSLSVVSDAYWRYGMSSPEAPLPQSLSFEQLLDGLAPRGMFEWRSGGRCLVFHHQRWYERAQQEVPESLVFAYREKLQQQGSFTLDDAIAFAVSFYEQRPALLDVRGPSSIPSLPPDLDNTGLGALAHPRYWWAMTLLQSSTPAQRVQAEREPGLQYSDMSSQQRQEVRRLATLRLGDSAPRFLGNAIFRLLRSEGAEEGWAFTQYEMRLDFPGSEAEPLQEEVRLPHRTAQP